MFEKQIFGVKDKHGVLLHNGDKITYYYKGTYVTCEVIYVEDWGMFVVKWPDGYINKWQINEEKIEILYPTVFQPRPKFKSVLKSKFSKDEQRQPIFIKS